VEKPVPLEA